MDNFKENNCNRCIHKKVCAFKDSVETKITDLRRYVDINREGAYLKCKFFNPSMDGFDWNDKSNFKSDPTQNSLLNKNN